MDKGLNEGSTDSYPFIGMGLNKINITFVCSTKIKLNSIKITWELIPRKK